MTLPDCAAGPCRYCGSRSCVGDCGPDLSRLCPLCQEDPPAWEEGEPCARCLDLGAAETLNQGWQIPSEDEPIAECPHCGGSWQIMEEESADYWNHVEHCRG